MANELVVNISLSDIGNSSQGGNTNMLAVALQRMINAHEIPGFTDPQDIAINCSNPYCNSNVYGTSNFQTVTLADAYCCGQHYDVDNESAIKIALQNVAGIKPSEAFTATLTPRN